MEDYKGKKSITFNTKVNRNDIEQSSKFKVNEKWELISLISIKIYQKFRVTYIRL